MQKVGSEPLKEVSRYEKIYIIEQLKSSSLNTAQKKATLKKREKFWQAKLKTLAPHGLNARLG